MGHIPMIFVYSLTELRTRLEYLFHGEDDP